MRRHILEFAVATSAAAFATWSALVGVAGCDPGLGTTATNLSSSTAAQTTASSSASATTAAGSGGATTTTTTATASANASATVATTASSTAVGNGGAVASGSGGSGATGGGGATATGSGGSSASTGSGGGSGIAIPPDATGLVTDVTLGITGSWYAYGDNVSAAGAPGAGNCETVGMHTDAECSSITSPMLPAGALGFPPDANGAMCLTGNAAVIPMLGSAPDYSNVFGIGIGLDFNNVNSAKSPWDAMSHGVTGVSFTITGVPSGGIRVEFPIPATDASGDAWSHTIAKDGLVTIHFATDLAASFLMAGEPPFDPTMIESIQFHVPTNVVSAVPVTNMCVSGLTALMN